MKWKLLVKAIYNYFWTYSTLLTYATLNHISSNQYHCWFITYDKCKITATCHCLQCADINCQPTVLKRVILIPYYLSWDITKTRSCDIYIQHYPIGNLTGISAVLLLKQLLNLKAMWLYRIPISGFWQCAKYHDKTSNHILKHLQTGKIRSIVTKLCTM